MSGDRRVVDDRVFLLGLDQLYREAVREHERGELLGCARRVAAALDVEPADVPVEGYYAEDERLAEYFRLVRALQTVSRDREPAAAAVPEFRRLVEVTSSRLFGGPANGDRLLPAGRDALSRALIETRPDWTVDRLTEAAAKAAQATDDISLVGLAARVRDAVVLAALRESVVLYAEVVAGAAFGRAEPEYVWRVAPDLAFQAKRFVDTFHALFGERLPPPEPAQAERYWRAYEDNRILGRCVRLGYDDRTSPPLQYHWGICRGRKGEHVVQEFWKAEVWTTERYRAAIEAAGGACPEP